MIDIYIDDMKCAEIADEKEGYRIDFKNPQDESLLLLLSEEKFVDLFYRMKRRCETRGLIPIHNKPVQDRLEGELNGYNQL